MTDKKEKNNHEEDLEQYMAMRWGSPSGLVMLTLAFAIFMATIGGFLLLLHWANIIK